jgi:hypothetical protein
MSRLEAGFAFAFFALGQSMRSFLMTGILVNTNGQNHYSMNFPGTHPRLAHTGVPSTTTLRRVGRWTVRG